MKDNAKILYCVNYLAFFILHRLCLAEAAKRLGYSVEIINGMASSRVMEKAALEKMAVSNLKNRTFSFKSSSINTFTEIIGFLQILLRVYKVKPEIYIAFL